MKTWKLSVVLLALAACAGISTTARMTAGTNLSQYRTFAWAPHQTGQPETLADQTIRSALEQQLAQKGVTPATNAPPDFLIDYHTKTQQVTNVYGGGYGGFYGYGWGYPDVSTYTEGTLIVDFVDPHTRKVFWRGTASGVAEHPNNPDPNRINDGIAKLMEKYPVQEMATTPRQPM